MHELITSKRFRSSWALLSRTELSVADRAAAINGVLRLLATEGLTLQDLLDAAVKGSLPVVIGDVPAAPRADAGFRPGFENIRVHVEPNPGQGSRQAQAQQTYERVRDVGEEPVPPVLIGTVRIDEALSNPRAAYGVVTVTSDTDGEWGPLRVYGSDLDVVRHARDHQIRVEGHVMRPSSSRHMPILTEVRAVA